MQLFIMKNKKLLKEQCEGEIFSKIFFQVPVRYTGTGTGTGIVFFCAAGYPEHQHPVRIDKTIVSHLILGSGTGPGAFLLYLCS